MGSKIKDQLEDEVDELFKLPLADFIAARKALATSLNQRGRADDADLVKELAKPSISAWTVNQLYWKHREPFEKLLKESQRFRQAQTSGRTGKIADLRQSLDARQEALSQLSDLATSLLRDAGHNPTPDTIRRITTTLEAMSAHATLADGPTPGRLSQDVDPPGFESLLSFMPDAALMKGTRKLAPVPASRKLGAVTKSQRKEIKARGVRQLEDARQARIAVAKMSLQTARKSLTDARATAHSLEAAQKKAYAEAKQAEKQAREAEQRLKQASAASATAAQRSRSTATEAEDATKAAAAAKLAVEKIEKEIEALIREQTRAKQA